MSIEAIKQAWEDLEEYCNHHESCRYVPYRTLTQPPCTCGYKDAVTALRQAIEIKLKEKST
jgi:hypothetical protein